MRRVFFLEHAATHAGTCLFLRQVFLAGNALVMNIIAGSCLLMFCNPDLLYSHGPYIVMVTLAWSCLVTLALVISCIVMANIAMAYVVMAHTRWELPLHVCNRHPDPAALRRKD